MLFDDTHSSCNESPQNEWSASQEDEAYQQFSAISVWSIISLLSGILSLSAIVNHSLLFISVITFLLVTLSYWFIHKSSGTLTGYNLLYISLFLSLIPLAEAPVEDFIYKYDLIKQAKSFTPLVIDAAKRGNTLELRQLQSWQLDRVKIPNELEYWKSQIQDPVLSIGTKEFIRNPGLVALANLGENANVTYFKTLDYAKNTSDDSDFVRMVYAVTYKEFGETKTFLLPISVLRCRDKKNGVSLWKFGITGRKPMKWSK